ncbi:Zinc finger protein 235-like [Plakobranchus ocellatus]|uniref:Zinc finger protein 235-like n=1 Tax=Plakobranchus ocellatus TaxID=259542 RepID=A0AAV4BSH9_9GAST|nr:Zinc finger protein 235-like [Plakobranchus ocellatus]
MVQARKNAPSKQFKKLSVASCKVCWACRGLFTEIDDLPVKDHLQLCCQTNPLLSKEKFEYFVCDRSDYAIFTGLKASLDRFLDDEKSIKNLKSAFPRHLVKHLIDLRVSAFPSVREIEQGKSSKTPSNRDEDKPSYYIVSNKECQTNIECDTKSAASLCQGPEGNSVYEALASIVKCEVLDSCDMEAVSENAAVSPLPSVEGTVSGKSHLDSDDELILLRDSYKEEKDDVVSFVCKLCSYNASTAKQMLRHQRSHNDGQLFECKACKFTTLWRRDWNTHMQQKHRNKTFLCHFCAAQLPTSTALDQHIVSTHADYKDTVPRHRLQCEHCDYIAREMASLKEHMRKHTGEKILCPHDGCKFASFYARSLSKHLKQKHSVEKTQCCYICGFQTRHASSLTKHITLIHKDFKPYKCAHCIFTALYPSEIITHAKSKHLKHKRFACPKCPFKTSYQLAIQKHIARHNETDSFACLVCGGVLASRSKAKKHMEKEHGITQFAFLEEPSWEKVNPNDYKIKEEIQPSIDLDSIVVLNETSKSIEKKKAKKSLSKTPSKRSVKTATKRTSKNASKSTVKATAKETGSKDVFEYDESALPHSSVLEGNTNLPELSVQNTNPYTSHRQETKEGNPMLSGTTADLDDNENSLSSLFDLMSDFPRPTTLNRCQSASTLMFASLSPHLIDRPLTPDFFTDSPSVASFFPNFSSKNLETDGLSLVNESTYENISQALPSSSIPSLPSHPSHFRHANTSSPMLPNFICSPQPGSSRSLGPINLPLSLEPESNCMEVDSVLSELDSCAADATTDSAFARISQNFASEIQDAVACVPISEEATKSVGRTSSNSQNESPFPSKLDL